VNGREWIGKYFWEMFPEWVNDILNATPFHRTIAFRAKVKQFPLMIFSHIACHYTIRAHVSIAFGTKPVGRSCRMIIAGSFHVYLSGMRDEGLFFEEPLSTKYC